MNSRFLLLALCGTLLVGSARADKDKEVEVLARGPVHEAYAEPTEREPAPTPIVNKEPPKPIEELPPDQKPEGDNVQWIPGYWSYDEDRKDYLWVSGFWRVAPPNRTWVAGSWRKAGDGWQWSGGFWAAAKEQKAEVEYLPKPPAPLDNDGANTPAPSESHIYVPGSWVWRERYVWRPGFWMEHRPNWVWTSAHYRWTPGGYVYIDGYWDYPLATRGTLFAPVYIPPVVYTAPAYVYTPTVYVREECLFGAFFARRGFGCYYFGDYFAPRYSSVGFVAWSGHVSATVTLGGFHDPLFSYYRCGYRSDPFWGGGGCVNLFVGRYRGDFARPPHTLVQQTTVINNITNNNITNINNSKNNTTVVQNSNLNNVTMLSNIRDGNRDGRRFTPVSDTARRDQQLAARDLREVGVRRADAETRLASGGPKGGLPGRQTVGLDVPTTRPVGKGALGSAGTGMPPAKGGLGTPIGNPPKGGLGTPMPKGETGIGLNPPPKGTGGVDFPPPPRATPIGKADPKGINIPPKGGNLGTGTGTTPLPMPKVVNPLIGTGTGTPPTKGPNIGMPPAKGNNPPTIPPTNIGNPPTLPMPKSVNNPPPTTPKTINNPPIGTMPKSVNNPPTLPPPPKTVNNPPTIAPPPRTINNPPTLPPAPKTINNPPPPRTVNNPPTLPPAPKTVTSPPPPKSSTPPRTTPPPKTKTSFALPTVSSPLVATPRPATVPLAQTRPLTVPPVTATPRLAPRPTLTTPSIPRTMPSAPRPAMINPRPATVAPRPAPITRVTPSIPRPAPSTRVAPIPSGSNKRPIRR